MKIAFLIRSLSRGGAERQLSIMAEALKKRGHDVVVLVFYPGGVFQTSVEAAGVKVINLEKSGRWDLLGFYGRLVGALRRESPDVLYSFLPDANVMAALAKLSCPSIRLVWGVRASELPASVFDGVARASLRASVMLSRLADVMIANSNAGMKAHEKMGYNPKDRRVIFNGIDTDVFKPARAAGERLRAGWGIAVSETVIGIVARLDPVKDHETFLRAVALLPSDLPVRVVVVGGGDSILEDSLVELSTTLGLGGRVIWTGAVDDMPAAYNAIDIVVSSSVSEGFSNAIAEAMACGRCCIATDVGDSANIIGATGRIVPVKDSRLLAEAMRELIQANAHRDEDAITVRRNRVVEQFGIAKMTEETSTVLGSLVSK